MTEDQKSENFRPLRSITRLLVGGILLGSDTFAGELRGWEGASEDEDSPVVEGDAQTQLQFEPLPDRLPPPQVGLPPPRNTSDVRYALIGLIFVGEEKLEKGLAAAGRAGNLAGRMLNPLFRPIQKLGALNPAQKRIHRLVDRGQSELDRWVVRGQEEEDNSRRLAQQAATSAVDQSILYMADNQAITELVQAQGVSLAAQILELVRAISVSTDYFLEGLARYVFRRRPRYLLPPPSQDVQEQAAWNLQDIRHEDL